MPIFDALQGAQPHDSVWHKLGRYLLILSVLIHCAPAPPPAPGTPSVTFPGREQLRFRWNVQNPDDVDAYLVNISGPDDQCGSRDILHRSTENSYTCSGWSPAGQNYTLTVQAANCGGEGPASDPVTVYLQSKKLLFACLGYSFSLCVWKAVKQYLYTTFCALGGFNAQRKLVTAEGGTTTP